MMQPDLFQSLPAPPSPALSLSAGRAIDRAMTPSTRRDARSGKDQRGLRDTSRTAYAGIKANGKLGKQQQEIYSHLTQNAHRDYTRAEIAAALGMRLSSVCGRVSELLKLQVLRETNRRECRMTGINSHGVTAALTANAEGTGASAAKRPSGAQS